MINHGKRHALYLMGAGLLFSAVPASAFASGTSRFPRNTEHRAYNGDKLVSQVGFIVSTLGVDSAITTIANSSDSKVTITRLEPGIILHNKKHYDLNAGIGARGVTLKPGQKRMLIAHEVKAALT